jgi:phage terminase small subunit
MAAKKAKRPKLSYKQRAFVEHYLITWNASEAARRAGYSKKGADVTGHNLLVNPSISAAIEARLTDLQMSADEALIRLAAQARGDMESFIDISKGSVPKIDLAKARRAHKLHLIKRFTNTTSVAGSSTATIELYDAQAALVQIGRAHGLFIDKTALTDPSGENEYGAGVTDEQRERAISTLAHGFGIVLSPGATGEKSTVGAAERAAVAGAAESGG